MKRASFGITKSESIGVFIKLINEDFDQHLFGVDEDLDEIIIDNNLDEICECMFEYIGCLTDINEIKDNLIKSGLEYDERLDECSKIDF